MTLIPRETGALEPELDKESLKVLRAVPEYGEGRGNPWRRRDVSEAASLWQIAETVDSTDLNDVRLTLNGLMHLEYVTRAESQSRKRQVWWRLPKGDEAAA